MDSENYLEWFYIYLKGFMMGSADAVPGISGGSIALITGIYGRLISSITSINHQTIAATLNGIKNSDFQEVLDVFHKVDGFFLLVLGSGILTAVVAVLNLVHYLLAHFPIYTFGFFWGLIAVSAIILYRQIDLSFPETKIAAVQGFLIAFLVSGFASSTLGNSMPVIFLSGALAVSAMVLPGISGSLILIILGQYDYMSAALSSFTDALISTLSSRSIVSLADNSQPVIVFVLGGFFGLFTIAHSIRWALENYREVSLAFLVSLVFGALRAPILEVEKELAQIGSTWTQVLPEFALMAVFGGIVVFLIDYKVGMVEI
jgi:putative membrane protein